jgi:enoyl-CoA hydratase
MTEDRSILRDTVDGIATVTVNRPERRNALSRDMWRQLGTVLSELRRDPGTRGMLLTGAGDRAFAAGADVAELVDRPPAVALDGLVSGILTDLEDLPFPTVAALNGHALGGGWELALSCDVRVAVPGAKVGFPEIGLGIMPGGGGITRLLQHVGVGLAKEWILTGRLLPAERAADHGLINRVVEPGALLVEARALLGSMTEQSPMAFRLAKMAINSAARGNATAEVERLAYALTYFGPERSERMRRFLDGTGSHDVIDPASEPDNP